MRKQEFLDELRNRLKGLPKDDLDERIAFYDEMIEDRIDDGKTEEGAVADIGTVDEVVDDIARDTPLAKLVKQKIKPKRKIKAWEIVLIALGFPLWFPLLVVVTVLCLVFYILFWVLVIVCYAVEMSLIAAAIGGFVIFLINLFQGNFSLLYLAISILAAGASVLMFFGCWYITKGTIKLHQKIFTSIKRRIMNKGDSKHE